MPKEPDCLCDETGSEGRAMGGVYWALPQRHPWCRSTSLGGDVWIGNKLDGNQPGLLGSDAGQQWVSSTQSVPEGAEKTLLVIMIILGK